MTRRQARIILLAAAALTAVVGYEARIIHQRRDELRDLISRTETPEQDLAALRQQHASTLSELQHAETQLAQLPAVAEPSAALLERERQKQAWLARVRALRQHFREHPEQCIPEMTLLTEIEWLRAAKEVDLATDRSVREALAAIRTVAKAKFTAQLSAAVGRYSQGGNKEQPLNLHSLAPYFDPPVDAMILERYEVVGATSPGPGFGPGSSGYAAEMEKMGLKVAGSDAVWKIQERVAIDLHFDSRTMIALGTQGGVIRYAMNAPEAWIPDYQERVQRAHDIYRDRNPGAPRPTTETLLPYVDPPFEPAVAQRLLEVEQARRR